MINIVDADVEFVNNIVDVEFVINIVDSVVEFVINIVDVSMSNL